MLQHVRRRRSGSIANRERVALPGDAAAAVGSLLVVVVRDGGTRVRCVPDRAATLRIAALNATGERFQIELK